MVLRFKETCAAREVVEGSTCFDDLCPVDVFYFNVVSAHLTVLSLPLRGINALEKRLERQAKRSFRH